MEKDNASDVTREGVFVTVPQGSENFENTILPPLRNSYMYEESKQSFRYDSAFLVKNDTLKKRYDAFRTWKKTMGYSEEELKESYGFLLFDDEKKANKLGEAGVFLGHTTCTTLGDPSKGVYVSKYSDCLDVHRWYHGKAGYIAIILLTKGRVREVTANYTVNYTSPSDGFDCHVSEQMTDVSANTSSFLAFERTQYYMYEQTDGGKDSTAQLPRHACPFAIVAFSYWNAKTPKSDEQEKREEERSVFHYYPWSGQLQISSQVYHVGLKSSTGPLMPAKLPTVIVVDGAIKMSDLRQKLPKAIFETCFSGEAFLEGMSCSLYELAPSGVPDMELTQLTQELKEKDLALTVRLEDNGFLILLHSIHFLTYEDAGSNNAEVLQAMFLFPDSRTIQRDTKICWKKPCLSPEGLQVVPALNYAEIEVEKCLPEQSGELCGLLEQHIQSYAALIHPGLSSSPSREASIIPDQYDFPDALKNIYSAPKWTEMGWQRLKSYFQRPSTFELSVSRAMELLAAGREKQGDESDDDIYYCLSSPEAPPMSPASVCAFEEQFKGAPLEDISNAAVVTLEDVKISEKTRAVGSTPEKGVKGEKDLFSENVLETVPIVQPKYMKEKVPSDLTMPAVPSEDFGRPGLNKNICKATGTTLVLKEVHEEQQKELPCGLSQPAVLGDDSGEPGKTKVDCNAPVVVQEKVPSDVSQPAVSAEEIRKAGPALLANADWTAPEVELYNEGTILLPMGLSRDTPSCLDDVSAEELRKHALSMSDKADCKALEVGSNNEGTNLQLEELEKDMPSGVPQAAVPARESRKPSQALTTKPNSTAIEARVEDNGSNMLQKKPQEEVYSDLSQLALSAKAFGIASMTVVSKATEVTGILTGSVSADLPAAIVIAATEQQAAISAHSENRSMISTEMITNNSSLPSAKAQSPVGDSAVNGESEKTIQSSITSEVCNFSTPNWRKRPRKRRRFSGLGKRVLRSTAPDLEKEVTQNNEYLLDLDKGYPLKKRKESLEKHQVRSMKLKRELMNLIQDSPLKKDVTKVQSLKSQKQLNNLIQDSPSENMKKLDVTKVQPLKTPREQMNLIIDTPSENKQKMDVTKVQSLKTPRELMNLIIDTPSKNKQKMDVTKVQSLKIQRKRIHLIANPSLKDKESKDSIHFHPLKSKESMDLIHDDHPLKKKTERWDLKAIVSECGRIFVPHGSEVIAKDIECLKVKGKGFVDKQCADEMMVAACFKVPQPKETGDCLELNMSGKDKMTPLGMSDSKEHSADVKMEDVEKIVSQKLSEQVQNQDKGCTSDKHKKKRQYVAISLSKLRTVLLTGHKRKTPFTPVSEELSSIDKKSKDQHSAIDKMESVNLSNVEEDRTTAANIPQEQTPGLDPDLALALGLTPKNVYKDVQKAPQTTADVPLREGIQNRLDPITEQARTSEMSEVLATSLSSPPMMGQGSELKKKHRPADFIRKKCSRRHVPISEGIRRHRKVINDDGTQVLETPMGQEQARNRKKLGKKPVGPESLSKGIARRQKFRRLRRFLKKDGSVQVTRLWEENYDFTADSKFTNDAKDKTVIRALHGPWDSDINDTNEQVQLIIHMWIGLFYSRSTARFFQTDTDFSLEEKDCAELVHKMTPSQVPSDAKANSPACVALTQIPEPDVLDLSNVTNEEAQPLCLEPKVLDLSIKKNMAVVDLTVNQDAIQNIELIDSPVLQPENGIDQENSYPKSNTGVESKVYREREDNISSDRGSELEDDDNEMNPDYDSKGSLENTVSPLESDRSYIILCEQAAGVYIHQDNDLEMPQVSQCKYRKDPQREGKTCDGEQNATCLTDAESNEVNTTQRSKENDSVEPVPEMKPGGNATNMAETVECDTNKPRDWSQFAISDVGELKVEMSKTNPNIKDSVEVAEPEVVNGGNDKAKTEITTIPPAVYETTDKEMESVGIPNVPKDMVNVTKDDRNYDDELPTKMQDGKDAKDYVLPVEDFGKDSVEEVSEGDTSLAEIPPEQDILGHEKDSVEEVSDGDTSLAEALPEQDILGYEKDSHNATSSTGDEAPPVVCDGNTSLAEAPPEQDILGHEKDSHNATSSTGDEAPPVVCDGNTSLAEAPPEQDILGHEKDSHNATSSTGDEAPPVVCDGNTSLAEAPPEQGNEKDSNNATSSTENIKNETLSEKSYGELAPPVACDGNTLSFEMPPERGISQCERDSQKATLSAVHNENYLGATILPVKRYGKFYIDGEPAVVYDRKGSSSEAIPVEQSADVLVTSVLQAEVTAIDKVLPMEIHQVSFGNTPYVGEFVTPICSKNVLREAETTVVETGFCRDSTDQEPKSMQGQSKSDEKTQVFQHSQDKSSDVVTGQMVFRITSEDLTQTKVTSLQGEGISELQGQVEILSVGVVNDSKDIANRAVHNSQPCQKEIAVSSVCDGENLFSGEMSVPHVSMTPNFVSRCTTPTVDEVSFDYIPIPDICKDGSLAVGNVTGVDKPLNGDSHRRCPTPTQDEPPFVPEVSDDHHAGKTETQHSNDTNENNFQNHLEAAVGKQLSDVFTVSCKKRIATSATLNTPSASSKKPYQRFSSKVRLPTTEKDLYSHSAHDSLHRLRNSHPKTPQPLATKAERPRRPFHPKALSNETLDMTLRQDLGGATRSPSTTKHKQTRSFRHNVAVSGPTAATQNLSVHKLKSEESRDEHNRTDGLQVVHSTPSDALKDVHTDIPLFTNTNAYPNNTPFVTEIRRTIASSQGYEDVPNKSNGPALARDRFESIKEKKITSDKGHVSSKSLLNKTKLDFINSLREYREWEKKELDVVLDFSKPGTSSSFSFQSEESDKRLSSMEENKQEVLTYRGAKRTGCPMDLKKMLTEETPSLTKPCLVTVLDPKGKRITYDNRPIFKPTADVHTQAGPSSNRKSSSSFLEFSKMWDDTHNAVEPDLTQSSLNMETLIFSEKMNQLLKRKGKSSGGKHRRSRHDRSNVDQGASTGGPALTVHFSSLQEEADGSTEHWEDLPPLEGQKIRVEMPERNNTTDKKDREMPQHLGKLSYTKHSEVTQVKVSDLVEESFKAYHAMMNEVCAGRKYLSRTERLQREEADKNSLPKSRPPSNDRDFCGQIKKNMCDSLHDNLNSVVRHACKNKFRFYMMVTSDDPFFKETKELLEAEGHIAVEPSEFCLGKDIPLSPLYIILRNEDIAEHICEVPHLLDLKKSPNVLFAGIDRPDDIVNLTHQELFCKGGFVVFEGAALDSLSLSNMKKMSGFLEGLSKKGKWKWLLHYRDSRKLKENARSSTEAKGKKYFMDVCQEAGMVEVLPYHDCDVISRERPNYLHCLERLQVQNISARLPVFMTDTTADKAFAKHGIFTMNINSFLLISHSDTCTVS